MINLLLTIMKTIVIQKGIFTISGLLLVLLSIRVLALPDGYEERYYNDMRYGLFIPPSYDPSLSYPLVLYLHGCNDTVSYDHHWYCDSMQLIHPCFVLTPKALNMVDWCDAWGNSWMSEHTPDMLNTLEIIDLLEEEFSIDTNQLHVYGISMGSFGTFALLARNPEMFASAIAICGGGNPITAQEVAKTPLWIFHGDADPMVPVERSRIMYNAIINAGGTQVRYTEYPGVDHDAWRPALSEPSFSDWFLAHEKGVNHGLPDVPENFKAFYYDDHIEFSWDPPSDVSNTDKKIWYYKLFRNDTLLSEIDGTLTSYTDSSVQNSIEAEYQLSGINYFFSESARSARILPNNLVIPDYQIDPYLTLSPNPVKSEAVIQYVLEKPGQVMLCIHNLQGKVIDIPINTYQGKGTYRFTWQGNGYDSSYYFCRMVTNDRIYVIKFYLQNE